MGIGGLRRSLVGSLEVLQLGLVGPPWSSMAEDCGLRMALGSILGHAGLGVAGNEATWSCRVTYLGVGCVGSTWEVGTV